MLGETELLNLREAGRIAADVRRWAEGFVKEGMRTIDVCEGVESEILRRGALPAFPCNVDINEIGAHYTCPPNDDSVIPKASIVKVDIGVHVNGYIADTATSICFNYEYLNLKQATEEALEAAIKAAGSGVKVSDIGAAVQHVIEGYGLKPIRNLTGHGLSRYRIHGGTHIPNVRTLDTARLQEGEVYAIEPFATTMRGAGEVAELETGFIYRIAKEKPPKESGQKKLFEALKNNFHSLPFALRWAVKISTAEDFNGLFEKLRRDRYVARYPVFVEKNMEPVGQAEHTIIVRKDCVETTTL